MADLEKKISKQVGWLNYNAGLLAHISCSDVLPPLVELGSDTAMSILKDVENNVASITNPTSYILEAAQGAGSLEAVTATFTPTKYHQKPKQQSPGAAPFTTSKYNQSTPKLQTQPFAMALPTGGLDPTGKIAKHVGWLNQHAGLQEKISYTDVVQPLSQLEVSQAMKILKDLEEAAGHVEHPTMYVAAAATRAAATGGGGAVPGFGLKRPFVPLLPRGSSRGICPNASPSDQDGKKIARQVGWLNQHAGMVEKISYSDVKDVLEALNVHTAMRILKDIEGMGATIRNPTAFLTSMAQRAISKGSVKSAADDEVSGMNECWDFAQGYCPHGDACRYLHNGMPAALPDVTEAESSQLALLYGLELGEMALRELSSIPVAEAEALMQEVSAGTKQIQDLNNYVSKACRRVRAEAFKQKSRGVGDWRSRRLEELIVKRMRLAQ